MSSQNCTLAPKGPMVTKIEDDIGQLYPLFKQQADLRNLIKTLLEKVQEAQARKAKIDPKST